MDVVADVDDDSTHYCHAETVEKDALMAAIRTEGATG
jgi:hypothetical protein